MKKEDHAGPMPEVTFSTFVLSLASSALVHLGEVPNPETGQTGFDPDLSKHSIDILEMLRAKTENGLDEQEAADRHSVRTAHEVRHELRQNRRMQNRQCACRQLTRNAKDTA